MDEPRAYSPPASHRLDIVIDSSWKFAKDDRTTGPEDASFDDSAWETVDLPHTWNNLDGQDGGNDYYRGIGWYRKNITPDRGLAGRTLFLQFDGANITTDVYVNGKFAGEHKGGFATFRCDVSDLLLVGKDNLIAVRVNNGPDADIPPLSGDFTFFGGLYRHVHLLATDRLAVTATDYGSSGVYLKQTNVSRDSATVEITVKVSNRYSEPKAAKVKSSIVNAEGTVIKSLESRKSIPPNSTLDFIQGTTLLNPHLWNARSDPYLYTVYVEVDDGSKPADVVRQPLGLRYFSVDHDRGFFLNGQYLDLHGVNKHQDRLNKGWAISESDMDQDFALIMETGATAVRLAHYQHPAHEYDLADRYGLVVWTEIPLVNQITDSPAFSNNARQQLIELIRQNFNHPSIFFWGIANEVTLRHGPDPNRLLGELAAVVRDEDPGRVSAIASDAGDTDPSCYHTDITGFNKYYGWYRGKVEDFASWADSIHRDATLATRKIGVTEYGAGSSIRFHSDTPALQDHTEEYQNMFHETYWKAMKERPFLWGKFVWNMFDFAADARKEGDTAGRNDKGLVTYDRATKKDAFYWYKCNWTSEPLVYITSRRFNPRPVSPITIKIYSNLDSVELRMNGESLGAKTSADHVFEWSQVLLTKGTNRAEAIGKKQGVVVTDTVIWERPGQ